MNALGRDGRTLILRGLDSPFRNVRLWACRKVALNHITVGVPGLIRLLNGSDPEVAIQAAVALEEISHIGDSSMSLAKERQKTPVITSDKIKPPGSYSSKIRKNSAPRSVFPLPGEGTSYFASGIEYYVKDLAPFKFVALSVGIFIIICFSKGLLPLLGFSGTVKKIPAPVAIKNSSVVFQDISPVADPVRKSTLVKSGSMGIKRRVVAGVVSNQAPGRDEVWLALARRYLEAGRPLECIKYCNRLIEKKRKTAEAQELKRLARERYGVIN